MKIEENETELNQGIFQVEDRIMEQAKEILCSDITSITELKKEYELLYNQYGKMLRQTKKLVRMGDNTQKKLIEANELIHEKVHQLIQAEEKLKKLSITDPLTGIYNRRGTYQWIEEQVKRQRRNNRPFTLFIMDIDFFKNINDTHGHQVGDKVLIEITQLMIASVREQDFLGRWGGEEFILILPETDLQGSVVLADKLRKTIEQKEFKIDGNDITITISLGGSCYSTGSIVDKCLEEADAALYRSKRNGRNRIEIHGY